MNSEVYFISSPKHFNLFRNSSEAFQECEYMNCFILNAASQQFSCEAEENLKHVKLENSCEAEDRLM